MHPDKPTDQSTHTISADQLRIGLYVHVDLPWFLHPFTRNSFRISSAEQIAQLRGLRIERFRYDPDQSEDLTAETAPAVAATSATLAPAAAEEVPQGGSSGEPAMSERELRVWQLAQHRSALEHTEKAFVKATGVMRRLTRSLALRSSEALDEMHGLIDQMATVFLERPDVSLHVMSEKCGGEEAYFHGLNVSVLSMLLARGLQLGSEQTRILGAGALLHDIGTIEVPEQVLKKDPAEHTQAERELFAAHVEHGVRIGRQLALSPEALAIIAQHHEMADGSGYPGRLRQDEIAPLARVVALVNYYENLCNPTVLSQAMTPHEALSFIFARCRNKFDGRVLHLMIRCLGVYPPGSVVRLSNNAIAMVVSVNQQTALRPWVLLYDAAVPKHEAVLLNLQADPGVSIAKGLRTALLPPAVYAYLSPRKRITYFFDSESPASGSEA